MVEPSELCTEKTPEDDLKAIGYAHGVQGKNLVTESGIH